MAGVERQEAVVSRGVSLQGEGSRRGAVASVVGVRP